MVAPAVLAAMPMIADAAGKQTQAAVDAMRIGAEAASKFTTSVTEYMGKPFYHCEWEDGSYLDISPGAIHSIGAGVALLAVGYVLFELAQPAYHEETRLVPGLEAFGVTYIAKVPNPPSQLLLMLENCIKAYSPGAVAHDLVNQIADLVL